MKKLPPSLHIFLLIHQVHGLKSSCLEAELLSIWKGLSWNQIVLLDPGGTVPLDIVKKSSQENIALLHANEKLIANETTDSGLNRLIENKRAITLVAKDDGKMLPSFRDMLENRQFRPYSIHLVTFFNDTFHGKLAEMMQDVKRPSGSYLSIHDSECAEEPQVFRVITVRHQSEVVRNRMSIMPETGLYQGEYNLRGLPITTSTLSWQPWLKILDCDRDDRNCSSEGAYKDIFDLLAGMFNFTLVVDKTPNNDWGTKLASGSFEGGDPVFKGSMGAVANDEHDIALSTWHTNIERNPYFDFSLSIVPQPYIVVINEITPPLDITLFFRPFTPRSWIVILLFIVPFLALVNFPWEKKIRLLENLPEWQSLKIAILSGWVFFLLVNAFYGGALTMFFSSESTLPFGNMDEALALYPDWEPLWIKGSDIYIKTQAVTYKNPLFLKPWSDSLREGQDIVQGSYEDAFQALRKPGRYLLASKYPLIDKYLSSSQPGLQLAYVSEEFRTIGCVLINKNSPMTPMINKGIRYLRQSGTLDIIGRKWTGVLPKDETQDAQVLQIRQVGLVFLWYQIAGGLALVVLMGEKIYIKFCKQESQGRRSVFMTDSDVEKDCQKTTEVKSAPAYTGEIRSGKRENMVLQTIGMTDQDQNK